MGNNLEFKEANNEIWEIVHFSCVYSLLIYTNMCKKWHIRNIVFHITYIKYKIKMIYQ